MNSKDLVLLLMLALAAVMTVGAVIMLVATIAWGLK